MRDRLLRHGPLAARRVDLERLSRRLDRVASRCRAGARALTARLTRARLREDIARASGAQGDYRQAVLAYGEILRRHPAADQARRARWRRAALALDFGQLGTAGADLRTLRAGKKADRYTWRADRALTVLAELLPDARTGGNARAPRRPVPPVAGSAIDPGELGIRVPSGAPVGLLRDLRRWSAPAFTRVVAYFSRPVRFLHGVLSGQPGASAKPPRLYVDFPGARLGPRVPRVSAVRGHLVHGLRLGQQPKSARLVLELRRGTRYQIYPLTRPYRVVVDVWKHGAVVQPTRRPPPVRVVALDPGHGGEEKGAVGPTGLAEKEVALAVARHAAAVLKARGLKVVMTRAADETVSLEARTAIALAAGADLFVSIHANADAKRQQTGIETYYLDVGADSFGARLAERENRAAHGTVSPYRLMLADAQTRAQTKRSRALAELVQRRLIKAARGTRPKLSDRGVRQAIFYVLLTARVPGILAEVSFISHPEGEAALRRETYRQNLGRAVAEGILDFVRQKR